MSYTDVEYKFKKLGKDVQIGKNVYFRYPELIEIGDHVIIDDFCYFTTSLTIGSFIHIGPHCSVIGGKNGKLVMGDFSGLSAACRIICCSDDYLSDGLTNPTIPPKYHAKLKLSTVEIGKHAVIGTGAVIHPAVRIGEGAAVGSMTLVTKDLDAWGVYLGIPARKVKERNRDVILRFEVELLKEQENAKRNSEC